MNDEKICPCMSRTMRYGDRILAEIPTSELVAELATRDGIEYTVLGETTLLRGPAKILVVRR